MRISIEIMFVVILTIVVSFGCKKHDNSPSIPTGFSAQINNVKWTATNYSAGSGPIPVCMGCTPDTILSIEADDATNKYINLSIIDWNGKAGIYNYPSSGNKNVLELFYNPNDTVFLGTTYNGISGNLAITKLSPHNIQGTFNAIMADMYGNKISITNGVFNLPLN